MRRAILCASLCNCRHSLRADDDEELVEVALQHMRRDHPYAPLEVERVGRIVRERSYTIEYVVVYSGGYGPEAEFGLEPF